MKPIMKLMPKTTYPSVTLEVHGHSQLKKTDPGGSSDPGPQAA